MNQLARGKERAFAGFRDVLAREMTSALPEVAADVARVVEATGGVIITSSVKDADADADANAAAGEQGPQGREVGEGGQGQQQQQQQQRQ